MRCLSRLRVVAFLGCLGAVAVAGERAVPWLEAEVSWIGNSFPGHSGWVPQDIEALHVTPEGDLYTNTLYEEGSGNVMMFDAEGRCFGQASYTQGWGYAGGEAVAANARYVFIAQYMENEGGGLKDVGSWPPRDFHWLGLSRRHRGALKTAAEFPHGKGGSGGTLKQAFLVLAQHPESERRGPLALRERLRGLVATDDTVYASLRREGVIVVIDAETMVESRRLPLERADRLALAPDGRLWALQAPAAEDAPWRLLGIDPATGQVFATFDFPENVHASALAFAPDGRLFVADEGVEQNLKILEGCDGPAPRPRLVDTFGATFGIYAPPVPGRVGPGRLHRPRGLGFDAAGNFYIAQNAAPGAIGGGAVIDAYAPDGTLRWQRLGLFFVDIADVDPATLAVYSKEDVFDLDLAAPPGEQAIRRAYTLDPRRFPDDPRLHRIFGFTTAIHRELDGQPFLFLTGMTDPCLAVYRFDPENHGEILIPCALFSRKHLNEPTKDWPPHQPETGGWRWRDANGDGQFQPDEFAPNDRDGNNVQGLFPYEVDAAGRIWWGFADEVRAYSFKGVDANGVPAWDWENPYIFSRPDAFDTLRRAAYQPETGRLVVGGGLGAVKHQHWKPMGPIISLYENVYPDAAEDASRWVWTKTLPYIQDPTGDASREPMGIAVAGDYLFVPYCRGLREERIDSAFVKVLRLSDGEVVGNLVAEDTVGELGLLDVETPINVRQLPDGRYLILLEDDYRAKNVTFLWQPE